MAHHFRDPQDPYDPSQGQRGPPSPYGRQQPIRDSPPQPRLAGPSALFDTRSLGHPASEPGYPLAQSISLPSISSGSPNMSPYGHYSQHSHSPSHAPPGFHQQMGAPSVQPPPGLPPHHLASAGLHAQKRAYRQRRKDPSCDACRERKVKCDATDTTSCSECSSRNVKCQFTKETNRRMSSIKQVQDLEKQLVQARQQLTQYRSMVRPGSSSPMEVDSGPSTQPFLSASDASLRPQRRRHSAVPPYPPHIRSNLRRYGRGLFHLSQYGLSGSASGTSSISLELPPKDVADGLLHHYHQSVHPQLPIIDWPTFTKEYEDSYNSGLHEKPRVWASLLFSILAAGVLCSTSSWDDRQRDARQYLNFSRIMWDEWPDDFTLDHARRACVTSRCLLEMNMKTAAAVALASAVSIAQDLDLHRETDVLQTSSSVPRRLISLELSRPTLIDDDDCDVDLPSSSNPSPGSALGDSTWDITRTFTDTLGFIRPTGTLLRVLRDPVIEPYSMSALDNQLETCLASLGDVSKVNSTSAIEILPLQALLQLQNARLILHRHNVSAASPADVRKMALQDSVDVAQSTARYLYRSMRNPSPSQYISSKTSPSVWQSDIRTFATPFFCTHLWRCALLLLFNGNFNDAMICVITSTVIGDARPVNLLCGRYLHFVVELMVERLQPNGDPAAPFDNDEELLAYICGDMQGNVDQLVGGFEDGLDPTTPGSSITDDQADDWGGWEAVEILTRELVERQQRMEPPGPGVVQQQQPPPRPSPDNSSRMTIANII